MPGNAPSPIAVSTLDTRYLGIAGTASAFVVQGDGGAVLVECGCAVAFDGLVGQLAALGLAPRDLAALFVTHIHLDHAGSAGHFAREGVPVFVHPRGVRHLAEPSRLIAGSRAVHGPRYDRFYGDPLPIAAGRLHAVEHGGVVEAAGLRFEDATKSIAKILLRTTRDAAAAEQIVYGPDERNASVKFEHAWLTPEDFAQLRELFVGVKRFMDARKASKDASKDATKETSKERPRESRLYLATFAAVPVHRRRSARAVTEGRAVASGSDQGASDGRSRPGVAAKTPASPRKSRRKG